MRFASEGSIDTDVVTVGRSRVRCRPRSAVWFQGQAETSKTRTYPWSHPPTLAWLLVDRIDRAMQIAVVVARKGSAEGDWS
jgi:hypothetical protein